MTLSKFDYHAPTDIAEAADLLSTFGEEAMVMAGGTDLLVKIRFRILKPKTVVSLKKIDDLNRIDYHSKKGLLIGATATLADVASHPDIRRRYPAVALAAGETANVQIRNMGTLGGNLCNAAPSADNAPTLLAMGSEAVLSDGNRERTLPLDQFFKGPGVTAIRSGEIMTGVMVPPPSKNAGAAYQHISARGKVDISAACVGVMVTMKGETCVDAKIALGAVASRPLRALKAEKLITGRKLTTQLIEKAGMTASKEARPITDVRASAEYRTRMISVLTKRGLTEAAKRARKRSKA